MTSREELYDYGKQAGQWVQYKGNAGIHGVTDPNESAIHDPAVEYDNPHDDIDPAGIARSHVEEMEPIPVRIVEPIDQSRNTRIAYRAYRDSVGPSSKPQAQQILGRDDSRVLVKVKPLGAGVITITHDPSRNVPGQGWECDGANANNSIFETRSKDAIYAIGHHPTDQTGISVYVEYVEQA